MQVPAGRDTGLQGAGPDSATRQWPGTVPDQKRHQFVGTTVLGTFTALDRAATPSIHGPDLTPSTPPPGGAPATVLRPAALTCQHVLDAVVVREVVRSAGGGSLVPGQRLLQVDLQPVQGRQAAVELRRSPRAMAAVNPQAPHLTSGHPNNTHVAT